MKKYMTPVTEMIKLEATSMVCASPEKGGRMSDFGAGGTGSDYANADWDNQGNGGASDTDKDYGSLNSTAKGSSLWDDFEDE